MLPLYLLAAHLVGDYMLQTRWQATGKFGWTIEAVELRLRHAFAYCAPFVPVALAYGSHSKPSHGFYPNVVAFMVLLLVAHFFTDAQRFARTPAEWLWWHWRNRGQRRYVNVFGDVRTRNLEPNPWPSIGLAIDQTLHMVQIAVLAGVFLA